MFDQVNAKLFVMFIVFCNCLSIYVLQLMILKFLGTI